MPSVAFRAAATPSMAFHNLFAQPTLPSPEGAPQFTPRFALPYFSIPATYQ